LSSGSSFSWAAVAIEIKPRPPEVAYTSTGSGQLRIQNFGQRDWDAKQGVFHNTFTWDKDLQGDFAIRTKCRKIQPAGTNPDIDAYLGAAGWYHQAVDTQDQYAHDGPYFYGVDTIGGEDATPGDGNSRFFLSNGRQARTYIEQEAPTSDPNRDPLVGWYVFETFVKYIEGGSTHIKVTRKRNETGNMGDTETYFPTDGDFTDQGDDNLTSGRIAVFNQTRQGYSRDGYIDWILVRKFVNSEPTTELLPEEDPTAVDLVSFTATGDGDAVRAEWETAQEIDNLGFNLYRSGTKEGPYQKINRSLIPGLLYSLTGKKYRYDDRSVTRGTLSYYKLEDIDTSGKHTWHGPVCVDWDADGMPDDWEIAHGLDPTLNDGNFDYDNDGLTNYEEYLRGTTPSTPIPTATASRTARKSGTSPPPPAGREGAMG